MSPPDWTWLAGWGPWLPLGVLLVVLVAGLVAVARDRYR